MMIMLMTLYISNYISYVQCINFVRDGHPSACLFELGAGKFLSGLKKSRRIFWLIYSLEKFFDQRFHE